MQKQNILGLHGGPKARRLLQFLQTALGQLHPQAGGMVGGALRDKEYRDGEGVPNCPLHAAGERTGVSGGTGVI